MTDCARRWPETEIDTKRERMGTVVGGLGCDVTCKGICSCSQTESNLFTKQKAICLQTENNLFTNRKQFVYKQKAICLQRESNLFTKRKQFVYK